MLTAKKYKYNEKYETIATYPFILLENKNINVEDIKTRPGWNSHMDCELGDYVIHHEGRDIYLDSKVNSVARSSIKYGRDDLVYIVFDSDIMDIKQALANCIVLMHRSVKKMFEICEEKNIYFHKNEDGHELSDFVQIYKYYKSFGFKQALGIKAWFDRGFPSEWNNRGE